MNCSAGARGIPMGVAVVMYDIRDAWVQNICSATDSLS